MAIKYEISERNVWELGGKNVEKRLKHENISEFQYPYQQRSKEKIKSEKNLAVNIHSKSFYEKRTKLSIYQTFLYK